MLKFFQCKKLRITIITEGELTYKVFAGFKNKFSISGLGRLLDVLLDEGVHTFVPNFIVANLDEVPMVA
jgi:hypothetical protein